MDIYKIFLIEVDGGPHEGCVILQSLVLIQHWVDTEPVTAKQQSRAGEEQSA